MRCKQCGIEMHLRPSGVEWYCNGCRKWYPTQEELDGDIKHETVERLLPEEEENG